MKLDVDETNGIKTVMSTQAGRRFVSDVLDASHWQQSPIADSEMNLALNVGIQEPGRAIFAKVNQEQPELTRLMLKERDQRRDDRIAEAEKARREQEESP